MSKKIINAFKSEVKGLEYADLKPISKRADYFDGINSGFYTYADLNRSHNLTINKQEITNKFINELYSQPENLVLKEEKNYRSFLKKIFTKIFEHANAAIPNDSIMEELITNYHQGRYNHFLSGHICKVLSSFDLLMLGSNITIIQSMDCRDSDCLELSFSIECKGVRSNDSASDLANDIKTPGFYSSVEFKLKYNGENVTYEDGKILLIIPKELENYRAGDDNLLDKLMDLINKVVEYFKKLCEKLGFKFDTRMEYDSERNIRIEHNLGKPLKVINEPDIYVVNGSELRGH